MISILYGLLSMIPVGIANTLSPIVTRRIGQNKTVFLRGIFIILFLLIALILNLQSLIFDVGQILFTLLIAGLGYIGLISYYKALSLNKIGLVSAIVSSYTVISILLSVIFLDVTLSLAQGILILSICLITVALSGKVRLRKKAVYDKGIIYAMVTAVAWGLSFFLGQIPNKVIGSYFTSFLIEVGIFLFSCLYMLSKMPENIETIRPRVQDISLVMLMSLLSAISSVGLYLGLRVANPGIVLAISGTTPALAAIIGYSFYKQKLSLFQVISISSLVICIFLLSLVQ